MNDRIHLRYTISVLSLLLVISCGRSSSSVPESNDKQYPDVIIITLDTLRSDHIGSYGYPRPVSPWLDRFARDNLMIRHTACPAVFTTPSHVSLFTGEYPFEHGVKTNHTRYRQDSPLLAEILSQNGYTTAAFISGYPLKAENSGLDRGFDHFDDILSSRPHKSRPCNKPTSPPPPAHKHLNASKLQASGDTSIRDGMETCRRAINWLQKAPSDTPVFIWIHLYDIHGPYSPPSPFNRLYYFGDPCRIPPPDPSFQLSDIPPYQKVTGITDPDWYIAQYDGEIRYVDRCLSHTYSKLRDIRKRDRIIVITSDHGESFLEHGFYFDHGRDLFEPCLSVPLILSIETGNKHISGLIDVSASGIDIFPTVLNAVSIKPSFQLRGLNLLGSDKKPFLKRIIFSETKQCHYDEPSKQRFCALQGCFKYIFSHEETLSHLFDFQSDPCETNDLSEKYPQRADNLRKVIMDTIHPEREVKLRIPKIRKSERERLKELGYIE